MEHTTSLQIHALSLEASHREELLDLDLVHCFISRIMIVDYHNIIKIFYSFEDITDFVWSLPK